MDLSSVTGLFSSVPTDWIIIGAFGLLSAFDVVRGGARRVATLALALPPAMLAFGAISSAAILGGILEGLSIPYAQALLFIALVVVMYLVVARVGVVHGGGVGQAVQAAIAGVAIAALAVTIWLQIPALDSIWHFGPQVQSIFSEGYRFWWLLGSYGALSFASR